MTNRAGGRRWWRKPAGRARDVHLSKYTSTVTLLVRRSSLAASMSDYLIRELQAATNVHDIATTVKLPPALGDEHLEHISVQRHDTKAMRRSGLGISPGYFVLIGLEPRTEWLPAICETATSGDSS